MLFSHSFLKYRHECRGTLFHDNKENKIMYIRMGVKIKKYYFMRTHTQSK